MFILRREIICVCPSFWFGENGTIGMHSVGRQGERREPPGRKSNKWLLRFQGEDSGRIWWGLIWEDILITDLLGPSRLNNLFLSAWLRFWPGHCNEGLLMCNSVCGLMCLSFGQSACKWFLNLQMLRRWSNLIIMSLYNYKGKEVLHCLMNTNCPQFENTKK